jgi:hypothetical protein
MVWRLPPNGLALSRRLKWTRLIERESLFLLLDVKIATIQPVGYSAVLGGGRWDGGALREC